MLLVSVDFGSPFLFNLARALLTKDNLARTPAQTVEEDEEEAELRELQAALAM